MHIGADEVFNLGVCKKCRLFCQEASSQTLYAKYMRNLLKHLEKKYAGQIKFIAWDDMFRGWSSADLDMLKPKGKVRQVFEPCIWTYSGDKAGFDSIVSNQQI